MNRAQRRKKTAKPLLPEMPHSEPPATGWLTITISMVFCIVLLLAILGGILFFCTHLLLLRG